MTFFYKAEVSSTEECISLFSTVDAKCYAS